MTFDPTAALNLANVAMQIVTDDRGSILYPLTTLKALAQGFLAALDEVTRLQALIPVKPPRP